MGLEWIQRELTSRPEDFKILNRRSWASIVEAGGWAFQISWDQISLGLDQQRWFEILDTISYTALGGGFRIVWLA